MNKSWSIVAVCVIAQFAQAQTVDRSVSAQPRGQVVVTNVAGAVQVRGWDRNEVQVRGELGQGVKELEVVSEGEQTVVKVVTERGRDNSSATLSIQVPLHSSLALNTVSADIQVVAVQGLQRLQSVSGDINTELGEGFVEVRTVSGDVKAKGKDVGRGVRVGTVSGDVRLEGVGMYADVNTISGDLQLVAREMARVLLKTVNGDVQLRTALASAAQVQTETVNGSVRLHLVGPVNANVEAKTFRGDLKHCFTGASASTRTAGPGHELRITQGDGSGTVLVKTLGGDIDLCE